mmetsp:Transcript_15987/g.33816  ORF Transcript_15987/g.33816 Transcript_15987/m.33816 type:complete len:82 (+) Transcript_15987:2-247(+)
MGTSPAQEPVDAEEGPNKVEELYDKSSVLHGSPNSAVDIQEIGTIDGDSNIEDQDKLQMRQTLQKIELYFKAIESELDTDD